MSFSIQSSVDPMKKRIGSSSLWFIAVIHFFKGRMLSLAQALCLLIAGVTKHESKRVGGKKVLQNQAFWHVRAVTALDYKTSPSLL